MGQTLRWTVLTTGLAITCLALPAAAHAAATGTVTMDSETGDYIGGGEQRVFDASHGDVVSANGSGGSLDVSVSGGTYGDAYTLTFAAPDGQGFQPGAYTDAQRTPFREAGHPGIDISGDGRGCNEDAGSFEVRDWAVDASGAVERAWIVYEQFCEGGGPALFGEVRIGEPASTTVPSLARWPESDVGHGGQAIPITVGTPGVTSVAVTGDAASDFVVRENDCTDGAAGCQVWVRFVPTAAGVRQAWLRLSTGADVPLQGYAYGGTTGLTMTSDAGDYIGGGGAYSYGATASLGVAGSRSHISAGVDGADGSYWDLDFVPAAGDILAPGTYTGATRYPFNGNGAGLDVDGDGRGCNELDGSFTVNELTFSGAGIRTLSISFEQHCEHAAAALRGTLSIRAGDTTPPPPWLVAGTPPVDPGTPPPAGAATGQPALTAGPPVAIAVTPVLEPTTADGALTAIITVQGTRHAAAAKAFRRAVKSLARRAAARKATKALLADAQRYRATLSKAKASSSALSTRRSRLLSALARERTSLKAFQRALTKAHGSALRMARERALKAVAGVA
jgi:hypothetical protein